MLGGLHVNCLGLACAKHGQLTHIWDVHANPMPDPRENQQGCYITFYTSNARTATKVFSPATKNMSFALHMSQNSALW